MACESEVASPEPSYARSAALSIPRAALLDMLSTGACARCIFRFFGNDASSSSPSSPSLFSSSLLSSQLLLLEDPSEPLSGNSASDASCCSVCLGVLEFACGRQEQNPRADASGSPSDEFAVSISEFVKREGHNIASFSLEISVPPLISANERAMRLYVKEKYASEEWFREKFLSEPISVKDALRLSVTSSLEASLGAKCEASSFRIRLTYTHAKASSKLQALVGKDHRCKRRKTEDKVKDSYIQSGAEYTEVFIKNESDAMMRRALDSLQDHEFRELFILPPEKVQEPCHLTFHCYRMPLFIGGRYLKGFWHY